MLGSLFKLALWWAWEVLADELFSSQQTHTPIQQYQPAPLMVMPKRSLDEMSDNELKYHSRIREIVKGNPNVTPAQLIRLGFKKISKVLDINLHRDWEEITVESLKLVAFEKQCSLEKTLETYEIFLITPRRDLGHSMISIWIRPRDRDYKPIKDKKKPEPKEEMIEAVADKPKTMSAGVGKR